MRKENTNLTNEKKSFKEVIKERKWNIIAGTSVVISVAAAGLCIVLAKDNRTMSEILSEGVLQDAIITTNNKINGRRQQLRMLTDLIVRNPNDDGLISKKLKIEGEVEILYKRLDKYTKKLHLYEIKDIMD